jgi:hypothetical protein
MIDPEGCCHQMDSMLLAVVAVMVYVTLHLRTHPTSTVPAMICACFGFV